MNRFCEKIFLSLIPPTEDDPRSDQQRLMQALGAFANIGYNQNREWYLNLIPTGLRKLRQVAERVPVGTTTQCVAQWLLTVV